MDEMVALPDEEDGGDHRRLTRDPILWRALVAGRLATAVTKTTRMEQYQIQEISAIKKQLSHLRREVKAMLHLRMVPATAAAAAVVTRRGTPIQQGVSVPGKPATLSPRPRLLSQLWDEWLKGIDGRLPAQHFDQQQRGDPKIKHIFCKRKPFWKLMERLIDGGHTAMEALDLIDSIYKGTMTDKLKKIKEHERLGGHWRLLPRGNGVGRGD